MLDTQPATLSKLRRRSLMNLSRMGHCAPSILQTLLDVSELEARWLVRLSGGLPGGIGNTGAECGGVTAPLLLLGLRQSEDASRRRLPLIVYQGHALVSQFKACHGTISCRELRGAARVPLRCISVVQQSPPACARALQEDGTRALSAEAEEAYARLYAHWAQQGFHCARTVFRELGGELFQADALARAVAGFLGGTLFMGMTCSALSAGVMAIGLALGDIERSRLRVLRMIATMAAGGDAFDSSLNAFNRTMNLGHELSDWFTQEFGSRRCRDLAGCDFSSPAGVTEYIESDGTARCRGLAEQVARRARQLIRENASDRTPEVPEPVGGPPTAGG